MIIKYFFTSSMASLFLTAHLDLKGVVYRPEFYPVYLQRLRELGFRAVLVEYEDRFPFQEVCFAADRAEVWTRDEVREFQAAAAREGLEVIPLQQCLGHLEYAFRWPEVRAMALPYGIPREVNIGIPVARKWMKELLGEMIAAHPASRFVHLGMDEARSLSLYAEAEGRSVTGLFLDYLDELCTFCERHGKTPMIWSDMLEEHLTEETLEKVRAFRDRVILVPWNYSATGQPETIVRFSGRRCSRAWKMGEIGDVSTVEPPSDDLLHFEDWSPSVADLAADFRINEWQMQALFQAGVWRKLGFRVWGGAGGSITADRSVLPYYHLRWANLREWRSVAERFGLESVIVTQWARSNSCSVPNVLLDTTWPILWQPGASGDLTDCPLFAGIPAGTLLRLFERIGRCREGWRIEDTLITEMSALEGQLQSGHYEWKQIRLLLAVQREHKRMGEALALADCYLGVNRLMREGWEPILTSLQTARRNLQELEGLLREMLAERMTGAAVKEWLIKVFKLPLERIDGACRRIGAACEAQEAEIALNSPARSA